MKKIILNIVMATLCLNFTAKGQDKTSITALKIGDTVPDITINNIINYKDKNGQSATTAKISDFKGKLLLLDFWATWCSSCISKFPELYDFQGKFKNRLQILLINTKDTRDDKVKVENFFNKREDIYQLSSAIYDTTLNILFPHKSIPHCVWVMDNKVVAITSAEDVNQANLERLINNGLIELAEKKDIEYNFNKPLFVDGNGGISPQYIFRSLLTGYISNLKSSNGVIYKNDGSAIRIFSTNSTVLYLYQQAYPEYHRFTRNQIIFNVSNPTDYSLDSTSYLWKKKNLFNYESSFPPLSKDRAMKVMQADLQRYFHLSVDSEYRDAACLVLKKISHTDNLTTSNSEPETNIYEKDSGVKYFKNYPLIVLTSYLNNILKIPIIDETGFKGKVSLILPGDLTNENSLRSSLIKQGFTLNREKRKLKFLVFSEPENPQSQLSTR